MVDAFQVTDEGQHREDGFDTHAFIPSSFLADFHVFGNTVFVSKAEICQGDGLSDKGFDDRMKMLVVHVHGGPIPIDDSAYIIQQHTNLDSNAPTSFVAPLFSNLLLTPSGPDWEQQL